MVEEDKLSVVLSEFARTLVTNFSIEHIINHLVTRIVDVLPVTAAGVTLISAGRAPRYIAASDESALRFERLQTRLGQGPCLSAYESGEAVTVPDLVRDARFPMLAQAAEEAGLAAVFTFPLRGGAGRIGALDLYRSTPGKLDARDMDVAQTLADVAAAYLVNADARKQVRVTADRTHHTSLHDGLTGLPNRTLLLQRLERAGLRSQRSDTAVAILYADIDRFKQVNDTHGHEAGDDLLIGVAQRLSGLVRGSDTLARFTGDEFVFLCENLRSEADAAVIAGRIDGAFVAPFVLPEAEVSVTASVGVAFADRDGDGPSQAVVNADTAMYQAKRKGGARHQVIDWHEAHQTSDRNSLEWDLRSAFGHEKLHVAYQPVVCIANGLVTGVESLVRWTHPDLGPVPATSIVSVAEQCDLIVEIGAWILERSCRDHAEWMREHPETQLEVAVNVSPRQLMSHGFRSGVAGVLSRTGMDPASLVLEITENLFVEDSDRAMSVLADLKNVGVKLAMDDFGSGYSSLNYLRRLPIDVVKIDQSFIADIEKPGSTNGAITSAITNLAHVLGMTVTAEGVETQGQRDEVSSIGCDAAQGYFYARPLPASGVSAILTTGLTGPMRLPACGEIVRAAP